MLKEINAWLNVRRVNQARMLNDNGYAWALGQFFGGRMCILEIEANVSVRDFNAFDAGIERALRQLREMNRVGFGPIDEDAIFRTQK